MSNHSFYKGVAVSGLQGTDKCALQPQIVSDPSTDEMGDKIQIAEVKQLRDEGVRIWSSFRWDGEEGGEGVDG